MKTVSSVLGKVKGEGKINDIMTGKSSFSKSGFSDLVSAMVNDTSFKVKTYDKDGKVTGETNLSELIRSDLKKTLDKANYPQKSEAAVLDTCEIYTAGLAEAIPQIVMQQIACGKKFELPTQPNVTGSIYLGTVPSHTKTSNIRDPKTQENLGTVTITNKEYVAIKAKSPAPAHLVTKVRKDPSGKEIK